LEAIAASTATEASDAIDEEEHLPTEDNIIQDLLGLVDGALLEISDEESSDEESTLEQTSASVFNAEQLLLMISI
jgi:hypothetical protein